ncbi:MAG TPA: hypothetical protein VK210_13530, partial [Terriglobia bacterium]|nr:hypothetical protein [Terriglobia bacterium]
MKLRFVTISLFSTLITASAFRAAQDPNSVPAAPPVTTASVEGIAVKLGTTEPVGGAEVELTRVEGTIASPLPAGFTEIYNSL